MASKEELIAEARRRALVREARRRSGQATPGTPTPTAGDRAVSAPAAPQTPLDLGPGRTMADVQGMSDQFGRRGPVTVGRAAMPETINKIMEERGMDYGARADALIGKGVADIGHGIKQLTVGLDPQDEADVQAWRDLSAGASMGEGEGFINAGTVGDIAGNIGAFAVPLGAAEAGLTKATSALPRWMSKAGAATTVGGAEGFAQPVLPDQFMSRAANTVAGAALPLALSTAIQGGRKALTGMFDRNEAAEILADEGVQTTLGQGVETRGMRPFAKLVKNIEENLRDILPGLKGGRERAEDEVAAALAKRAVPPGFEPPVSQPGTDTYFKEMDTMFERAYKDALAPVKGRFKQDDVGLGITDAFANKGRRIHPRIREAEEGKLTEMLEQYPTGGLNARELKDFQNMVRQEIRDIGRLEQADLTAQGIKEIYEQIDTHLNGLLESRLSTEGANALRATNKAYGAMMFLEDARGFQRARDEPEIPVRNLEKAVRKRTSQRARVRGYGGGQDVVDPAYQVMGPGQDPRWFRALGGVGLGAGSMVYAPLMATPALVTSMVGSRRGGARALFGLTPMQQRAKEFSEAILEPKVGTASATALDTGED